MHSFDLHSISCLNASGIFSEDAVDDDISAIHLYDILLNYYRIVTTECERQDPRAVNIILL